MKGIGIVAATAVALLAVLGLTATDAGSAAVPGERCEYVEAGPLGPQGNRFVVEGGEPWLNRKGDEIVLHEGPLGRCSGPRPTVHNIDRIVLRGDWPTIGERSGRFAPGATHEHSGSEIEIDVYGEALAVHGGNGRDSIRARSLAEGTVALNLNTGADGLAPDYDVRLIGAVPTEVRIDGESGDDLIDARRLAPIGDNAHLRHRVRLVGGSGDDTIFGSPGEDRRLEDGPGDDRVRAGDGDDYIEFGPGRDTIYGEGGDDALYAEIYRRHRRIPDPPDRLYGGPGADVIGDGNLRTDLIWCGSGLDLIDREPRDRQASHGCEERLPQRGLAYRISASRFSSAAETSSRTGPSASLSTSDSRKPSMISVFAPAGSSPREVR